MPLSLGSHSLNNYAFSKVMYRCNTIDLRIGDIKVFNKTAKSFLYVDLLEKPDKLTLYRNIEDGGLGRHLFLLFLTRCPIMIFLQKVN